MVVYELHPLHKGLVSPGLRESPSDEQAPCLVQDLHIHHISQGHEVVVEQGVTVRGSKNTLSTLESSKRDRREIPLSVSLYKETFPRVCTSTTYVGVSVGESSFEISPFKNWSSFEGEHSERPARGSTNIHAFSIHVENRVLVQAGHHVE